MRLFKSNHLIRSDSEQQYSANSFIVMLHKYCNSASCTVRYFIGERCCTTRTRS